MIPKVLQNRDLCKVRTVTSFLTLTKDKTLWEEKIKKVSLFGGDLAKEFNKNNYEVQSIRVVTNAFGEYLDTTSLKNTINDMQFYQVFYQRDSMPNIRIRFAIGEAKTDNEIHIDSRTIKR